MLVGNWKKKETIHWRYTHAIRYLFINFNNKFVWEKLYKLYYMFYFSLNFSVFESEKKKIKYFSSKRISKANIWKVKSHKYN